MNRIEQIKMIAKFMDIPIREWHSKDGEIIGLHITDENGEFDWVGDGIDWYQPDQDWNQLMNAVDKITEIDISPAPNWSGYKIEIVPKGYVKITGFPMPLILTNVSKAGSLISALWVAVMQFLEWYYQQNPIQ